VQSKSEGEGEGEKREQKRDVGRKRDTSVKGGVTGGGWER